MTNADKKPLLAILDGHGIIHRAYYALKDAPLVAKRTGENTSGVFGFTNTLLALLDDLKPTHLVVTMDLPGPTFRHVADATYKASRFENLKAQVLSSLADVAELNEDTRREMAESVVTATNRQQIQAEMRETAERSGVVGQTLNDIEEAMLPIQHAWDIGQQIQRCLEMMEAFNIPVYSAAGFEADDVIGTLSEQASAQGIDTQIVTMDSDMVQLIRDNVWIYMLRPYQRDHVIYDAAGAQERYGFPPERMMDYKALIGDTSDNIPGVPGIGPKTAARPAHVLRQHRGHLREPRRHQAGQAAQLADRVRGPGALRQRDGDHPPRRAGHHPRDGGGAGRPLRPPARPRPAARPRVPHPRPASAVGRRRHRPDRNRAAACRDGVQARNE